jgi:hypothetical protein
LIAYAREAEDVAALLRSHLREFEARVQWLLVRSPRAAGDQGWDTARELDDLGSWVAHVGWAFAVAGASGDATASFVVDANPGAVDAALASSSWHPSDHVISGDAGAWFRALNPRCVATTDRGYRGSGFVVGPDAQTYPLAAPFVVRNGVEFDADNGLEPGQPSVLDLDGLDPGWVTIDERIGVERWRDAPGMVERALIGIGSTVAGPPNGSTEEDVEQLVVEPGRAPYFSSSFEPEQLVPQSQPAPVPGGADPKAIEAVPLVIDVVGGAALADRGSFAAYDITFQQHTDGRRRALYKRVYVGFDDGSPYADSVWIHGPASSDRVLINYAN